MKNIKISSILLGGVLLLSGCEKLEYYNPTSLVEQTFWQTEDHAKQGIVGCYTQMKYNWCMGFTFALDQCSDLVTSTTTIYGNAARGESSAFSVTDGAIQNHWTYLYELVHRTNSVIRNVSGMEINETVKNNVIGEAKFLRAMAYFELINCWGDVPYYGEDFILAESYLDAVRPRESKDVVRQHIIEDLTDAAAKLPVSWDAGNYGRATKGAAISLRGKVYLYNKEWQNAINDFEDIVYNKTENYGYELDPNWEKMFHMYPGIQSKEYIFSMLSQNDNGSYGNELNTYLGGKQTFANISGNPLVPSVRLIDMYENKDGSKFKWTDIFPRWNESYDYRKSLYLVCVSTPEGKDPENSYISDYLDADAENVIRAYEDRDPRLAITAITPFSHTLGVLTDKPCDMQYVFPGEGSIPLHAATTFFPNEQKWYSYLFRKFVPKGTCDGHFQQYQSCPYEFPFIRLADVILMLSEAYNEANQLDKAIVELNKVRSRVDMPTINNGDAWMQVSSKDEMTQRIRNERAYELAIEGHRFHDLRRWGIYETAFETENDIFGGLIYARKYQERYNLWPIPQVARERNPNLTQNPGW